MKRKSILMFLVFLIAPLAHAATALPAAPPHGYCYDSFTTPNYNGVRECSVTPAPPPPGQCVVDPVRARLTTMLMGFNGVQNLGADGRINGVGLNIDVTQTAPVFGRGNWNSPPPPAPFPFVNGEGPTFRWTQSHTELSLQFTTPASGLFTGDFAFQSNNSRECNDWNGHPGVCGQPIFDVSISQTCGLYGAAGDYTVSSIPSDGTSHVRWSLGYNQPLSTGGLQYNTAYDINIRFHDPADYWRTVFVIWHGFKH